ncbi:MAG: DNA polymerase III subunit gamma/tau [Candidatus Saccharibacteria bacterium]
MDYLALYRQWRPQRFCEVVGQKSTITGLTNAVKEGKLSHAYLFSGPRGTGKTSVAKIMAKAVNCPNQSAGEPCNECSSCKDINSGAFMDVIEIDAASNRGIDEIRDLREKVRVLPAQGKKKVYIIDEVHMLTTEAFNALLKTLEEPPDSVMFVLATTESQKIPATVLSRCQRYAFMRLTTAETVQRMQEIAGETGLTVDDAALEIIARRANGSLRDALSTLDQCVSFSGGNVSVAVVEDVLGLVDNEVLIALFEASFTGNIEELIQNLDKIISQGKEPIQIARDAALGMRDLLHIAVLKESAEPMMLPVEALKNLLTANKNLSPAKLSNGVKSLLSLADSLRFNEGQRFLLEVGFLDLMEMMTGTVEVVAKAAPATKTSATSQMAAPAPASAPDAAVKEQKRKETPKPAETSVKSEPAEKESSGGGGAWDDILEKVKANKVTTHALLVPAKVMKLEGDELILGYKPELKFHREKMQEKGNQAILKAVLEEVLGHEMNIRLVSLEGKNEQAPAVSKALEIFGKDKVEIID